MRTVAVDPDTGQPAPGGGALPSASGFSSIGTTSSSELIPAPGAGSRLLVWLKVSTGVPGTDDFSVDIWSGAVTTGTQLGRTAYNASLVGLSKSFPYVCEENEAFWVDLTVTTGTALIEYSWKIEPA